MKILLGSVLLMFTLVLAAAPSYAIGLDAAKAQGLVGEQPTGYLGIVGNPTPEVQRLVDDINSKRRAAYTKIAQRNGTKIGAVEKIAGKKAIEKTASGHYVKNQSGLWIKVP